jgi:hypothetical protein
MDTFNKVLISLFASYTLGWFMTFGYTWHDVCVPMNERVKGEIAKKVYVGNCAFGS